MATDRAFLKRLENPVVGIRDQYLALKKYCPGTVEILDNDKTVQWEGTLQPTPVSREYQVVIRYTLSQSPVCVVKSPDLTEPNGHQRNTPLPVSTRYQTKKQSQRMAVHHVLGRYSLAVGVDVVALF